MAQFFQGGRGEEVIDHHQSGVAVPPLLHQLWPGGIDRWPGKACSILQVKGLSAAAAGEILSLFAVMLDAMGRMRLVWLRWAAAMHQGGPLHVMGEAVCDLPGLRQDRTQAK